MPKINQIYNVVNQASKNAFGGEAIEVADLTGLISLGDKVLSSNYDLDAWLKSFTDLITKQIVSNRAYSAQDRGLSRNLIEFGAALQKVYIEPYTASESEAWKISEDYDPVKFDLGNHNRPEVKVKIFEADLNVWKYTISIPQYQIKTGFLNETNMAAFISAVYTELENAFNIAISNLSALCEANFIGEKLDAQKESGYGKQAVNLLKVYNDTTNAGLTVSAALRSPEFWRFTGMEIDRDRARFKTMNRIYNTEGYARFTTDDRLRFHLLSDVAAAYRTYLESDTFHDELIKLSGYEEIPTWQGLGEKGTFEDVSSIKVTTTSGKTVEQSGIIACIFDNEAMGTIFEDVRQNSLYDPEHDLEKIWYKSARSYFNDLTEQGIIYYIAEDDKDYLQIEAA